MTNLCTFYCTFPPKILKVLKLHLSFLDVLDSLIFYLVKCAFLPAGIFYLFSFNKRRFFNGFIEKLQKEIPSFLMEMPHLTGRILPLCRYTVLRDKSWAMVEISQLSEECLLISSLVHSVASMLLPRFEWRTLWWQIS